MAILSPPKAVESNFADFGFETKEFRVAVNQKTFKILIDGLYNDKITSILRELGTNAYDSHLMAGCPERPFLVKLPSTLDTTFTIRDYGTSLSDEDIMNMYVTIFESTKDKTNDQVGSFGLGSKSPFSYTDSFSVRAWKDGLQRDYIVGYNNDGIPTISRVRTVESDEETGLEISFAVNWKDFSAFQQSAIKVYQWFPTLPDIPGLDLTQYTKKAVILSGSDWEIQSTGYNGPRVNVRQGCVVYPVGDTTKLNASHYIALGAGAQVVIDVPIGSVSVVASRESLSLDDPTVEYLREVFMRVSQEIIVESNRIFNEAPSLRQALVHFSELRGKIPRFDPSEYKRPGMKKGISVKNGNIEYNPKKYKNLPSFDFNIGGQRPTAAGSIYLHPDAIDRMMIIVDRGQKMVRKKIRLRNFMNDSPYEHSVNGTLFRTKTDFYGLNNPTNNELKSLMRFLELRPDQIVSIASLEDVPPPTRTGVTGKKAGLYQAGEYGLTRLEDDGMLEDEFFWMPIDKATGPMPNYDPAFGWGYDVTSFWSGIRHLALWLGLPKRPVYFFTPNAVKRLSPDAEDKLDTAVMALVTNKVRAHVKDMSEATQYRRLIGNELLLSPQKAALAEEWLSVPSGSNAFQRIFHDDIAVINTEAVEREKSELKKKYPLLFPMPTRLQQKEYIEMINEQQENK